jgi:acyl transferase domain-containing protein
VSPADVQFVELHGTGTRVGDPVEARALGAAIGAAKEPGSPLVVGSAKTNVGHLEGAAGIVGLLKTALAIRHRRLPASLNFETPSPLIPFDDLNLRVNTELSSWPREDAPLVAGVSSFGMGGANCHVVVAEHPLWHRGRRSGKPTATRRACSPIPWPAWSPGCAAGPILAGSATCRAGSSARRPKAWPA